MLRYLNVATIIEPFERIRLGMSNSRNAKLLNKCGGGHIGVTSSINNQIANLVFYGAPGAKDHVSLSFVIRSVLGV